MILQLTWGGSPAGIITNMLGAVFVATRASSASPPSLVSSLIDYYWHGTMASSSVGATNSPPQRELIDIRTKRRIRGEDRGAFMRVENQEAFVTQVGMRARFLLTPS